MHEQPHEAEAPLARPFCMAKGVLSCEALLPGTNSKEKSGSHEDGARRPKLAHDLYIHMVTSTIPACSCAG